MRSLCTQVEGQATCHQPHLYCHYKSTNHSYDSFKILSRKCYVFLGITKGQNIVENRKKKWNKVVLIKRRSESRMIDHSLLKFFLYTILMLTLWQPVCALVDNYPVMSLFSFFMYGVLQSIDAFAWEVC